MARWGRKKAAWNRGAALAVCALTAWWAGAMPAGASAVSAGPASAAAWRVQPTPNATMTGGQIQGISCSAATACTAVGSTSNAAGKAAVLAERWNGTTWKRQTTPELGKTVPVSSPALTGVSCPAAAFCEAVGSYTVGNTGIGLAESWNGTAWKRQTFPVPPGSAGVYPEAMSCASASFCEAAGVYQVADQGPWVVFTARWNGTTWQLQHPPQPSGGLFPPHLDSVSCVSASFCEAGGSSQGAFALRWNGTKWTLQTLPANAGLEGVSCLSASFCEAVSGDDGATWNGTTWAAQAIPPPAGQSSADLSAVSCTTATFCAAVGDYDGHNGTLATAASWNGTTWNAQAAPSPAAGTEITVNGVSCASATACEAGGSYLDGRNNDVALTESWTGTAWQLQPSGTPQVPAADGFAAVSCVSDSFCEAVGGRLDATGNDTAALAERWNGTTWTLQRTASPVAASNGLRMNLAGVSCVSASFCEAVGTSSAASGGGAEQWNGTTWTLQSVPGDALTAVSCTATDFCLASGADGDAEVWNGTAWADQPTATGFSSLSSVSCGSASACEAIGYGPETSEDAEGWNGTTWTPQVTPAPSGGSSLDLNGVTCPTTQFCQAAGWYFNSSNDEAPAADVWNGSTWVAHAPPLPAGVMTAPLAGVACATADFCAAVGQQSPAISTSTLAEVWNGTSWSLRTTPNPAPGDSSLTAVSCDAAGTCTGVGVVNDDGGGLGGTLAESGD